MMRFFFFCSIFLLGSVQKSIAQQPDEQDTFFLAKQKGLLGKLGKSISRTVPPLEPVTIVNPYLKHKGKIIRVIEIVPLGFDRNIYDTSIVKNNFGTRLANALHVDTRLQVIKNNLFFAKGDRVVPLLIADNEHYLREQEFLKDARIVIEDLDGYDHSVKVTVFTRDVFSVGGNFSLYSPSRAKMEIREDNLAGSGHKLSFYGLMDQGRNPKYGLGTEVSFRNIKGSFLNFTTGFKTFNPSFSSGRLEENNFYTRVDKQLVSRYSHWMGAAEFSFGKTTNGFHADSSYNTYFAYSKQSIDLWVGYNFGSKAKIESDKPGKLRHFVGIRTYYNHFFELPDFYTTHYNSSYADRNGALLSYTLYKQDFVRTSFIYGFGRYEDVPEGYSATITGGYTNVEGSKRPYYGLSFEGTDFTHKSFFTYLARLGGYYNKKFEDVGLLLGVYHFTKLRQLGAYWRNRNFISLYFSKQMNSKYNAPLYLNSQYGLPYFHADSIFAQTRTTLKLETVFFNLNKFLGFRFAPFAFADFSFIQQINLPTSKTHGYTAIGAGVRTRNENFTLGTIELRGYYFPSPTAGMKGFRGDLSAKIRFKYNNSFIRRPELVTIN